MRGQQSILELYILKELVETLRAITRLDRERRALQKRLDKIRKSPK